MKTTTAQATHQDPIARSELEDTCSLREDHNPTMVVDNTVTKCSSKCHIKIAHHMEVSHSQVMAWIKSQAKSEASSWTKTPAIPMEFKTLVLQWLPSLIPLLCKEENEISLVHRSNNYQVIRTCKVHLVDTPIRFINNNSFNKCKSNLCTTSQQQALLMDQDQVTVTMHKV